ncbi:MAG: ATP/GTP-binding protein [Ilumatobacteraceae bacterium]
MIAGGFAAGKTTFVESISEITPLTTEAPMTHLALGVDNTGEVSTKTTTTVAMDFGRITLGESTMLYLFGTPGQDRFWSGGTNRCGARSERWSSPTPAGSPTASRPSTSSSPGRSPTSWPQQVRRPARPLAGRRARGVVARPVDPGVRTRLPEPTETKQA